MPSQPDGRLIDDVVELVQLIELEDIFTYEERARRIRRSDDRAAEDDDPRVVNSLGIQDVENGIGFRFRMVYGESEAEFVADFQARYSFTEPITVADDVKREFAERVAFLAVYPYLRMSVQASATRLGVPAPVLGIVRQGELKLGDTMTQEQIEAAWRDTRSELN